MAKVSLNELRTRAPTVDQAKLEATTDDQIETYKAEDGYADVDVPETARVVGSPQSLRVRLGMTQKEVAAAFNIPIGTWRNWEQGRVSLEPAAQALLTIVAAAPEIAFAALSSTAKPEVLVSPKAEQGLVRVDSDMGPLLMDTCLHRVRTPSISLWRTPGSPQYGIAPSVAEAVVAGVRRLRRDHDMDG